MVLHMNIMRKSFKKLAKVSFSHDKENMVQSYDYVLESVRGALESEIEVYNLNLNIKDVDILHSFFISYTQKLCSVYKEIGMHKVSTIDFEQIKSLNEIRDRLGELLYLVEQS